MDDGNLVALILKFDDERKLKTAIDISVLATVILGQEIEPV